MQLEIASTAASGSSQETGAPSPSSSTRNLYEDSGLGHFFRAVARLFDRMADNFAKEPGEKSSKREKAPKPIPAKPAKPALPKKPVMPLEPVQAVQAEPATGHVA